MARVGEPYREDEGDGAALLLCRVRTSNGVVHARRRLALEGRGVRVSVSDCKTSFGAVDFERGIWTVGRRSTDFSERRRVGAAGRLAVVEPTGGGEVGTGRGGSGRWCREAYARSMTAQRKVSAVGKGKERSKEPLICFPALFLLLILPIRHLVLLPDGSQHPLLRLQRVKPEEQSLAVRKVEVNERQVVVYERRCWRAVRAGRGGERACRRGRRVRGMVDELARRGGEGVDLLESIAGLLSGGREGVSRESPARGSRKDAPSTPESPS